MDFLKKILKSKIIKTHMSFFIYNTFFDFSEFVCYHINMHLKNPSCPFGYYHRKYSSFQASRYLGRMILTAKTFDDWSKVYRNLYWALLYKHGRYDLELVNDLKIFSVQMMISFGHDISIVKEELIGFNDLVIGEMGSLSEEEVEMMREKAKAFL